MRVLIPLLLLLTLAGCSTPAAVDPATVTVQAAVSEDAPQVAGAEVGRFANGTMNYGAGFGSTYLVLGEPPEILVLEGDVLLVGLIEWEPSTPTATEMRLLLLVDGEPVLDVQGPSPLRAELPANGLAGKKVVLDVRLTETTLVHEQDVHLALSAWRPADAPILPPKARTAEGGKSYLIAISPVVSLVGSDEARVHMTEEDVRLEAFAEWTSPVPLEGEMILRLTWREEVLAEVQGVSPLQLEVETPGWGGRTVVADVFLTPPAVVVQQHAKVTLTAYRE